MTRVTCRLTAKNQNQLRNPTLDDRVWATFTFYLCCRIVQYKVIELFSGEVKTTDAQTGETVWKRKWVFLLQCIIVNYYVRNCVSIVGRLILVIVFMKSAKICNHFYFIWIENVNLPSVLWYCWLDGRKGIRPVKNWEVRCWRGYLSGARCRLAYGPADATATHLSLAPVKSRLVLPFW